MYNDIQNNLFYQVNNFVIYINIFPNRMKLFSLVMV